jgi:endoglucanase
MLTRLVLAIPVSIALLAGAACAQSVATAQQPLPPALQPQPGAATRAPARPVETVPSVAVPTSARRQLKLDGRQIPLGGALRDLQAWRNWKARYVTQTGRVVDTANDQISHSEGQGYGMLLAVAANDRQAFERIWGWTRANLMVRDDQLSAWRWQPNHRPAVADMNNASDGDILIAWALAEAAELWADVAFRSSARRIAVELARKLVLFKTPQGHLLLPGITGFSAQERPDGPVLNISYYVFPAFQRLHLAAPEIDWNGLSQTGLDLIKATRLGQSRLPPDWISMKTGTPRPAEGFPTEFSYNAIRIPLYMAWAGIGGWEHYDEFQSWASRRGTLATIDVLTGRDREPLSEGGYASIGILLACALDQQRASGAMRGGREGENYYPATLHLLALTALHMRYPQCLAG